MTTALKLLPISTATAGLFVALMTGAPTLTIRRARLLLALLRRRLSRHRQSREWRPWRAEAWEA